MANYYLSVDVHTDYIYGKKMPIIDQIKDADTGAKFICDRRLPKGMICAEPNTQADAILKDIYKQGKN